jgi:hypothetical protein
VRADLSAVVAEAGLAPVEYGAAVERYLAQACLSPASRRVYRISLAAWAWALVGTPPPAGSQRRGARPPTVPLALLDSPDAAANLSAALALRARHADARTVNRELSALRGAVGWWLDLGWIARDPTCGLRHLGLRHLGPGSAVLPALSPGQVAALFRADASLREHAFWRLLRDTGRPAEDLLALDASAVDLHGRGPTLTWSSATADRLSWLLAGRSFGPLFLTDRRAPASANPADVCPLTGRARMSYRRAAEIFTTRTRPLDPTGRGWTLHQLRPPA